VLHHEAAPSDQGFLRYQLERRQDQNLDCHHDLRLEDRSIVTVDALAGLTGVAKRSLQRLFHEYVGVPPKWAMRGTNCMSCSITGCRPLQYQRNRMRVQFDPATPPVYRVTQ